MIRVSVDMRDSLHGILEVRETIQVESGPLILLFPQWIQGSHAPDGPIGQLAGLQIEAGGKTIPWNRSSTDVYAFSLRVPEGVHQLDIHFGALTSPWTQHNGGTEITPVMGRIQWYRAILYPQGHPAAEIGVSPEIQLPSDWKFASALAGPDRSGEFVRFDTTDLETLIDSPVYAGKFLRQIQLSAPGEKRVTANFFGDTLAETNVSTEEVDRERRMVAQAYRLFGPPHYKHYDLMVPLSDSLFPRGLEHLESSEDGWRPRFLTDRNYSLDSRDRLTHEFTHSWNGKYKRPEGLTALNFNTPLDDSLLWVYEGGTSYWGVVLAGRSGMWTTEEIRDLYAVWAADYDLAKGKTWRDLQDTTNDAVLLQSGRQFWPDWQRAADYYDVADLMWLGVDIKLREVSNDRHSLDEFAHLFFAGTSSHGPKTYTFDDVVKTLNDVVPFDWKTYLLVRIKDRGEPSQLLSDLARGGYRLVYSDVPSAYEQAAKHFGDGLDLSYSLGFTVAADGKVGRVGWDSPSFVAGLVPGIAITSVNRVPFSTAVLRQAIIDAQQSRSPIELGVTIGDRNQRIEIDYHVGLRHPHLERVPSTPDRLDRIFEPLPDR